MFTPIALISALASVAWAQSSSSYIPSGISDSCTKFLTAFNQDNTLDSCTSSIISATSNFAPGSTAGSSSVTSALDSICSSNACQESTIRATLTDFYGNCTTDLTSNPNKDVILLYDVVYNMVPLKQAMCTKDDDNSYCVKKTASKAKSAGMNLDNVQTYLAEQTPLVKVNATAVGSSNLVFLFLQPSLPSADLCTTCTRNILTPFISWESTISYAPGLASSQLLSGQTALYESVVNTCGQNFLSGSVAAAGGISSGWGSRKNSASVSAGAQGVVSSILGALAVAFVSAL